MEAEGLMASHSFNVVRRAGGLRPAGEARRLQPSCGPPWSTTAHSKRRARRDARRVVPAVKVLPVLIVFEHQRLDRQVGKKILRLLGLGQIFEMRLAVSPGLDAAKLHRSSYQNLTMVTQ